MKALYSIVGMQFRPKKDRIIAELRVGEVLELRRDRNNQHDANAVEVWARGIHIGFIKGAEVLPVAREMDQRGVLTMIARFVVDGSHWPHAEIDLDQ